MQNARNHTPAPMSSAVINLSTPQSNGPSSPESLVTQFISIREQLVQREQSLAAELAQIRSALKDLPAPHSPPTLTVQPPPRSPGRRTGLSAAVVEALASGPLTKDQILEKLRDHGFPLPANPRLTVDPVLYNTRRFRREGKLFSLAEKAA